MQAKMNRKISILGAACLLSAWIFTGCGDDPTIPVSIESLENVRGTENAAPIGDIENTPDIQGTEEVLRVGGSISLSQLEQSVSAVATTGPEEAGPPEPEAVTITISAVGDVSLGNHHTQDYYNSFRQAYDKSGGAAYFLENVSDIFTGDDMTIVNLEGVLTLTENMTEGRDFYIKGDPSYAKILTEGDVEAVSMANNHRMDYGEEGTRDTVAALEAEGILYAYDRNVAVYETKGIKIGYLSVNVLSWGAGVEKLIQEDMEKLRQEDADLIIVCCHWGIERENYPQEYQQTLGKMCIDWGADLVIGHHPHVLQGIEEYQGKYIVYSLGNFCFGANRNPDDKDTMIFQQTFTFIEGEKQESGEVQIIPCSISSVNTRNDFKPTPAVGEDAQRIIDRINTYSKDFGLSFDENGRPVKRPE